MAVPAIMQANEKCMAFQAESEQLIPGIPNDITLDHIAPKMSWRVFHTLSCVSRGWLHAIRTRQVYNARIRSQSTETVTLLGWTSIRSVPAGSIYRNEIFDCIALYSMRDNSFVKLPPAPTVEGVPQSCECVALDGKVYVFGRETENTGSSANYKVFVFDLAVQREWKQCASMKVPRGGRFACGVVDGKIYRFGGFSCHEPVCGSEVFDPKENTWSTVRPMRTLPISPRLETVGKELFVHSRTYLNRDRFDSNRTPGFRRRDVQRANFAEVYHPGKDEWRMINRFNRHHMERLFVAQGKLHSISWKSSPGIHVYDAERNSWTELHSFSYKVTGLESFNFILDQFFAILAVDDELLAIVDDFTSKSSRKAYLIKSKGFGKEIKGISWQLVQFSPANLDMFPTPTSYFMYPIQL